MGDTDSYSEYRNVQLSVSPGGSVDPGCNLDTEQDLELILTVRLPVFNKYSRIHSELRSIAQYLSLAGYIPKEIHAQVFPAAAPVIAELDQKLEEVKVQAQKKRPPRKKNGVKP